MINLIFYIQLLEQSYKYPATISQYRQLQNNHNENQNPFNPLLIPSYSLTFHTSFTNSKSLKQHCGTPVQPVCTAMCMNKEVYLLDNLGNTISASECSGATQGQPTDGDGEELLTELNQGLLSVGSGQVFDSKYEEGQTPAECEGKKPLNNPWSWKQSQDGCGQLNFENPIDKALVIALKAGRCYSVYRFDCSVNPTQTIVYNTLGVDPATGAQCGGKNLSNASVFFNENIDCENGVCTEEGQMVTDPLPLPDVNCSDGFVKYGATLKEAVCAGAFFGNGDVVSPPDGSQKLDDILNNDSTPPVFCGFDCWIFCGTADFVDSTNSGEMLEPNELNLGLTYMTDGSDNSTGTWSIAFATDEPFIITLKAGNKYSVYYIPEGPKPAGFGGTFQVEDRKAISHISVWRICPSSIKQVRLLIVYC